MLRVAGFQLLVIQTNWYWVTCNQCCTFNAVKSVNSGKTHCFKHTVESGLETGWSCIWFSVHITELL